MATARFKPNRRGIGQMLRDPMLDKGLVPKARAIQAEAKARAPRTGRKTSARFGGQSYADSFGTSKGTGATRDGTVRRYARVSNTNRVALHLEYGTSRFPARRTLRTAAGITRFDAAGDKYG